MDKSAHAAVLTEPRNFEFRDFPIPEIAEHDGLLRVEAAGLCGTDYEQFGGHLKDTPWDIRPIIPGHEIQGWIEKIGDEASRRWRIKEGDRVIVEASIPCGKCYQCQNGRAVLCSSGMGYGLRISSNRPPHLWGGYATHMYLHPQANVHRAPDSMRRDVLSLCNPMSNAVRWGYERGRIGMGDSVFICGPGQRGLLAVLVAKAAGASLIIVSGTAQDRFRLEQANLLGAHATIIVDEEDPVARAKELTGNFGVDVVLDVSAGAIEPLVQAVEIVRPGGRIVLAGLKKGRTLEGLVADKLILKEITLEGVLSSSWSAFDHAISLLGRYESELMQLCTHVYGIDNAEKALKVLGREIVDGKEAVHVHIDCVS
jgi:alcohol dehydrogenase